MKVFLIIDDNKEQAETVQTNIQIVLDSHNTEYAINTLFPFEKIEDYFAYIEENEVCVLILDEKLNNQPNADGKTVDYLGHNLVTILRSRIKDLPIYTITNYANDSDLQHVFSEYEQIISRKDFYESPEKYVPIMVRAASKFVDRSSELLSELTQLSQEIASGDKSTEKIARLKALQTSLELPLISFDDRQSWLDEYEKQLTDLKSVKDELEKRLNKR